MKVYKHPDLVDQWGLPLRAQKNCALLMPQRGMMAASNRRAITFEVGGHYEDPTSRVSGSVYTSGALAVGTVATDRLVLMGVVNDGETPAGVTLAGNATTLVKSQNNGAGNECASIWQYALPTGTTAVAAVTLGATGSSYCGITLLGIYSANSVIYDTDGDGSNATASKAIDHKTGGLIFGVTDLRSNTDRTFTWTNNTEHLDMAVETTNATYTAAAVITLADGTTTVSCAPSGAGVRNPVMALVSYQPA